MIFVIMSLLVALMGILLARADLPENDKGTLWCALALLTMIILPCLYQVLGMPSLRDMPYSTASASLQKRRSHHQRITHLEKCLMLSPKDTTLLSELAFALEEEERFVEAGQAFLAIHQLLPQEEIWGIKAAECFLQSGLKIPLVRQLLLNIDETSPFYRRAQALLSTI